MKNVGNASPPEVRALVPELIQARRGVYCVRGCTGFEIVTLIVLVILVGLGWSGMLPMHSVVLGILTAFVPLTIIFSYLLFRWGNSLSHQANDVYAANVEREIKGDKYNGLLETFQGYQERLKAFVALETESQNREEAIEIVAVGRAYLAKFAAIDIKDKVDFGLLPLSFQILNKVPGHLDNIEKKHGITQEELEAVQVDKAI